MDLYFKLKLYSEYIIPAIIVVIAIMTLIISFIHDRIREFRIKRFFISHGYIRKFLGVSSVGAKYFWGWRRSSDEKIVDDRDIKHLSMKTIKEEYS